jgi:glycine/D-amino acid oxidase-like deaminating enzyme
MAPGKDNSAKNEHLTRTQSLRDHKPLWASSPKTTVRTGGRPKAKDYDVVIVGAGISGALMGLSLSRTGKRILIVDRREPVRGSSMASTAMIQHEIDVPLHALTKLVGAAKAERVWQRSARAVEEIVGLVADNGIDCGFERKKTLFLAGEAYGSRALRAEVDARADAGIAAKFLDGSALRETHGIDRTAAIESTISASANPAQMTAGILNSILKTGIEIVGGLEIKDFRSVADQVVISTAAGDLISARHLVFCTGYEFLKSLENKNQSLISTWAIASKPHLPRPKWLDSFLVWEGSDPYLYFRTSTNGRVIVGGEDEDTESAFQDDGKAEKKAKRLVEKLGDLTGIKIGEPDFVWSAAFATTPNGLPMIGAIPGHANVYVTMGFGGNGITFSQIAASIIASEIAGHRDPDADLFPFQ